MNKLIRKLSILLLAVSLSTVGFSQGNTVINFVLTDTFGDGWDNGAIIAEGITVEVTNTGVCPESLNSIPFSKNVTLPFGAGPLTVECAVALGSTINLSWQNSIFNGETQYSIFDAEGNLITSGSGGSGLGSFDIDVANPNCGGSPPFMVSGTDTFGDGWNGATIQVDYFDAGGQPLGQDVFCSGNFGAQCSETGGNIPAGTTTAEVHWSPSCGTFSGEISNWSVTFTPPGGYSYDAEAGVCVSGGGPSLSFSGSGCVANGNIGTITLDPDAGGGPLIIPCFDGDIVLEDGDCYPSLDFCVGDLANPPQTNACDFFGTPYVVGAFSLFNIGPAFAVDCDAVYSCDNELITVQGNNGGDTGTGCDEDTCPNINFTQFPITMIPISLPAGYTQATFNYTVYPDCTNNWGEDQFTLIQTDPNGNWVIGSTQFLVFFGSGVQSGQVTVDVSGLPPGNGFAFYLLTGTGADINGVDGVATAEISVEYIDATGNTFLGEVSNQNPGCDLSTTLDLDQETGTVSINLTPGDNDICLSFWDGCSLQVCETTVFVDDSEIKRALGCNDHVNISVNEDCEVYITADMVLEGSPYLCDDEYIIEITTTGGIPVENPLVYDPTYAPNNDYIVSVYDPWTCNSCWGTVTLEDKIPPTLECPCPPSAWVTDPSCNISCLDVERYLEGRRGTPDTNDNCGGDDAAFSGATIVELDCGEYVLTQTWTLTVPGYGGDDVPTTLTCVNEYYVTSPVLQDELDCPDDETFDCTEGGDPSLTHPDNTGYPEFGSIELGDNEADFYCNIFAGYEDLEIPACGFDCYGPIKILRTWTILDWCTGETAICNQVVKIVDDTAPTIEAADVTVSTEPWVCSADVWFDTPLLHDDCTYDLDWYIASTNSGALLVDEDGQTNQGKPLQHALNVPKGWWNFTLASTDCCGNTGYWTIQVHVLDLTPPVAVATQNLTVSLTSSGDDWDGLAKVYASSINNGSHDNCSDVWVEIRRDSDPCDIDGNTTYSNKIPEACDPWYDNDDHDYGDYVKFCCADIPEGETSGVVKVWMRVWDDGNMDGVHGSFNFVDNPGNDHDYCEFLDNYNETWVHVTVEDKAPVALICPPDVTIPCHWDWTDESLTGTAVTSSTCGHNCVTYTDWPSVHCGEGYVLREWRVVDCESGDDVSDYICVQRITVEYVESPLEVVCPDYEDFNGDILYVDPLFPNHITVDCATAEFPEPWQSGGKCSLIGVSESVDTFFFEDEACFKVIKNWHYVDWCTGEEATCEFVIAVVDTEPPVVMCQDTCFAVDDYWDGDEDGIVCELASDVSVESVAMDGDSDCNSEWIKWVVHVDLWYDGTVDIQYSSFLPHSDPYYLEPTMSGDVQEIDLDKDDISAEWARHVVEWKAFDGCGNVAQCVQYVEVRDKKAPTPYCVGISTALMSPEAGNLVEIWAKDFNLGSFDNCTADYWLRYTFGEVPPVADLIDEDHCFVPVWDDRDNCIPQRDPETGYIVSEEDNNCNDYEDGSTRPDCPIDGSQKWSPNQLDDEGNPCKTSGMKFVGTDWCGENDIRVSVWDKKFNMDFCWITLIIHGTECEDNPDIPRIEGIIATDAGQTVEGVMVTNSSDLLAGGQEQFMTAADGAYAFDNNLMGGDYAITADKNNDYLNGVSTLDLVLIQKHILGLTPLTTGTKVVAADINNDESISAVDLVELRKLILGIYTELPDNSSWRFVDADQPLNVSNPWPITEEVNISNIAADMMAEDFTGIKVGDVNGSVVANASSISSEVRSGANLEFVVEALGNGTVAVKAGENFSDVYGYQFTMNVTGSVAGVQAGALNVTDANFGILSNGIVTTSFASESAVSLAAGEVLFTLNGVNNITLVNGITRAEAYQGASYNVIDVTLRDGEGVSEFALSQNEPNPFSETTNIAFTLGQSGNATLTVYDVTGKVVKVIAGEYERGNHVIEIAKRDLAASGVLYYQLESGDFTATKKMIVIE